MVLNKLSASSRKVYTLSWSEFSLSLSATAQNLRNVEDLTDVTVCAGGKIFPAHKLVLSAASPLLMELLKNTKCQHPILMLAGISSYDLEIILEFIYRGEINIDSDKLQSLLQAAEFLDIRALLPTALVLNSSENIPTTATNKDVTTCVNSPPVDENNCHQLDEVGSSLKRRPVSTSKKVSKVLKPSSNITVSNNLNQINKINHSEKADIETPSITSESSVNTASDKSLEEENQEVTTANELEKKIISDLPVNCKLCGVTIRQSRNLRRHIDQMHSKTKFQQENSIKRKKKQVLVNRDILARSSIDVRNADGTDSSLMDDFSQDSFSQLTEEILNYSAGSESEENSFSNTMTIPSTTTNSYSVENAMHVSHAATTSSTPSPSRTSIIKTQSFPTLLEDDMCFQLSTKNNSDSSVTTNATVKVNVNSPATERFECTNLDDSCHVNDIELKELENQLFSACFCSTENI